MTTPQPYTRLKFFFATALFIYFILVTQPWNLYFLNDDFVHIPLSTKTIWVHFFFFRPVANMVTATEVKLYGNNPFGFHITSILLHTATSYFVTLLANALMKKYGNTAKYPHAGFIIGCLFFIYPFHSEPLLWVIGRISMIATFFYVLSLLFFIRATNWYHRALSLLFFIPALFTYEISWTLPLVITVLAITDHYTIRKSWSVTLKALLPHWIVFGLFLGLRSVLLHRVFTEYDVEGRNLNMLELIANFFRLFARTLVPPHQHTPTFAIGFSIALLLLLILVVYLFKKKALTTIHLVIACLLCITYLPVISIGIDTHGTEGERYLYLPSVFWIIGLVWLLYELPVKLRSPIFIALFSFYATQLASAAKNYQHASHISRVIMNAISPPAPVKNIVAVNLPTNYKGAMLYRMSFDKAVRWMHPDIQFDTALVIPATRTFEKMPDSIRSIPGSELPTTGLRVQQNGANNLLIEYNGQSVPYTPATDLLLFFPPDRPGIIIYPGRSPS